jgi:hypothetical protein
LEASEGTKPQRSNGRLEPNCCLWLSIL